MVGGAIDRIHERLPFPLFGLDSDNDSAFVNGNLTRYCLAQKITFTGSRRYKKNDQARVEKKNWSAVQKLMGYARYDFPETRAVLGAIIKEAP